MTIISDLVSASAKLHSANALSDEEYDRRIRDHVEYLRQLISTKALESAARDDSLFDVSSANPFPALHDDELLTIPIECRIWTQ